MTDMSLVLEGVRCGYGSVEIIHGVDLRVAPGEIVTILGPNGAGKSTLVRAIAGLLPCRGGQITLGSQRLDTMPAYRRMDVGVAIVPEGRALFKHMSVRENLLLGRRAGSSPALDQVYEIFPVLAERSSQLAGTLSGGQQQMLAIGRALMSHPSMLVLDEPSLGLAPIIVQEILERLPIFAALGTGVLLVEQNARQALMIADTAVVLERGQVVSIRPASEVHADADIVRSYLGGVA